MEEMNCLDYYFLDELNNLQSLYSTESYLSHPNSNPKRSHYFATAPMEPETAIERPAKQLKPNTSHLISFQSLKPKNEVVPNNLHAKDHVIAERKRREKLTQHFIALSATLPGLKKVYIYIICLILLIISASYLLNENNKFYKPRQQVIFYFSE